MSTEHTQGRLEVADGRRIGVVLPNEVGGGFDSHCVALAQDSGGRLNAEANARRLVACWNACDGVGTDLLEQYPAPFTELRTQRDQLLAALKDVLSTHSAECKAELSLSTATENYSDHSPELDAYTEAAVASSKAETDARSAIAKVKGGAA